MLSSHGASSDVVPKSCGSFCNGLLSPSLCRTSAQPAIDEMKRRSAALGASNHDYLQRSSPTSVAKGGRELVRIAGGPDRQRLLAGETDHRRSHRGFTQGPISLAPGRPPSREVIVLRAPRGGVWQRNVPG